MCGLAPNVGFLVAARAVQGVGAAMLLPGSLAIISRAFPHDAERAEAIGVWAGIGSLALPAGPLVGGALIAGSAALYAAAATAGIALIPGPLRAS